MSSYDNWLIRGFQNSELGPEVAAWLPDTSLIEIERHVKLLLMAKLL